MRAWCFIWGVIGGAATLSVVATLRGTPLVGDRTTWAVLVALAVLAQLFRAEAPHHVDFYATQVFLFAGVLLLPPPYLVLLVLIPHVLEWAKERLARTSKFEKWYLQPFNIGMYTVSGLVAQGVYGALSPHISASGAPFAVPAVIAAAVTYVAVNHLILGWVLRLARGISWRDSGVFAGESLLTEFVLACLGSVVATLWIKSPWLIPLALTPLVLIYRALLIPKLRREAQTDAKTGLANARHFAALFAGELDRARRFERPLAVVMADLDRFKAVNDTYGHLAGDAVLAAVAGVIRATTRDYDIACRFGGEEFALVLPEMEPGEVRGFAERLRLAVAETRIPVAGHATPLAVTLSAGIACFPADGDTPDALIAAADAGVYVAKARGRNRVVLASDLAAALPPTARLQRPAPPDSSARGRHIQTHPRTVMVGTGVAVSTPGERDVDVVHDQALTTLPEVQRRGRNAAGADGALTQPAQAEAVRRLIGERGITIAFQPIWNLGDDRLLAVEALARPNLASRLQGPRQAFDIAEQLGCAHDLDAICRAEILRRAGDLPPRTLLFLNVSPHTLDRDLLGGTVLVDAVREAGLTPDQVVLELTERAMARLSVVVREANRLRALGFKLALDDTGAGNAGLEMLSRLPVDFLKVDRAVMANALVDSAARAVLAGILAIARETGTAVIAEGIETVAMLRLVREMSGATALGRDGVRGAQGYLLGRPEGTMPVTLSLPWSLTA
ncbi:MAG: hypothetical protein NVSMB65_01690 [Chloroflexota bacterium]